MPAKIKEKIVADIEERFKQTKNVFVTEFQGLNVSDMGELRSQLHNAKSEYKVLKNSLTSIALKKLGHDDLAQFFEGPIGVVFEKGDPATTCKVLVKFAKDHEKFKLKSGLLYGKIVDIEQIKNIAKLPSRQVLLGRLAAVLAAPITNFARVLNAPLQGLVNSLNQTKKAIDN